MVAKKKAAFGRSYDYTAQVPISKKSAEQAMHEIWDEYSNRLRTGSHQGSYSRTKSESAKYFLAREIYALGTYIYRLPPERWSTKDIVAGSRAQINRPDKVGHVFHDLLMSVYQDDMQIDRRERWQVAQELEYARRHDVPVELVCGFLLQSGPRSEVPKKLKSGYIEPGFPKPTSED